MNVLTVEGKALALDKDGYLLHLQDWTPTVADALARQEGISLSDAHWEILALLREFYD